MLVVFSPIFVADTKVTFIYNFVAPLSLENLKSDSHLPKKFLFICFNENPLKVMKFLFHLKRSFRSQDIQIFVLRFW